MAVRCVCYGHKYISRLLRFCNKTCFKFMIMSTFWRLLVSLEWMELSVSGSLPPPRCGHTATMVEKRLLVFGGRGIPEPKYLFSLS